MSAGSRVYVGGLPHGVRERDLQKFFKGYGRTVDISIKDGYGFVQFEDYRDADDAVYELNGEVLLGERIVVEPAKERSRGNNRDRYDNRYNNRNRNNTRRYTSKTTSKFGPTSRTQYRLIVENLSSRVSWQDLKDYMRQAGEVTYADTHKQRRNEGVVDFASLSDLKTAIDKLDDTELKGRRIRLVEDKRGGSSRNGGGSGTGGGRRRSRSSSSRSRSPRRRSRSTSRRVSRSRSKSRNRSTSRSRDRSPSSKSREVSKSKSRSRSRSQSKENSRLKERSISGAGAERRSPSNSPKNNGISPGRKNDEVMDD